MVSALVVALALAAPVGSDCPGDPEKPAPLRCLEAGDHAGAVAAARAELRRGDATADDRRFAAELADVALRELYAADKSPSHLCDLEAFFAEYIATPGFVEAAKEHRNRVAAERRKNHPQHRCAGEASPVISPSSGPSPNSVPLATPPSSSAPPSSRSPASSWRKPFGMTIGGSSLLVATVGLGAGAAALATHRGELADRGRAVAGDVVDGGGWTPALEQERDHILEVDRLVRGAMVGLAVSSGVAAVLGVGLVVGGERGRGRQRAEVAPYGGAQGAGLVLRGRF